MAMISTIALYMTAALYGVMGIAFARRSQWGSSMALGGLALFALLGALA
jgi:hypothetical protein